MQAMPINFARVGDKVQIINTMAGKKMDRKLMEMGLNKGIEVQVMKNDNGALILDTGGCKLALGHGMAHKIMVKVI